MKELLVEQIEKSLEMYKLPDEMMHLVEHTDY